MTVEAELQDVGTNQPSGQEPVAAIGRGSATAPRPPARHGGWRRQRGQSLVEFALTLPLLLILVFGIIDFGNGLRAYIALTNGVREGARYGAIGNPLGSPATSCVGLDNTTVVGRVCTSIGNLNKAAMQSVSASCQLPAGGTDPTCSPGNSIVVQANYRYNFITPLGDLMHFFTGGALQSHLDLSSSANMRLE